MKKISVGVVIAIAVIAVIAAIAAIAAVLFTSGYRVGLCDWCDGFGILKQDIVYGTKICFCLDCIG